MIVDAPHQEIERRTGEDQSRLAEAYASRRPVSTLRIIRAARTEILLYLYILDVFITEEVFALLRRLEL